MSLVTSSDVVNKIIAIKSKIVSLEDEISKLQKEVGQEASPAYLDLQGKISAKTAEFKKIEEKVTALNYINAIAVEKLGELKKIIPITSKVRSDVASSINQIRVMDLEIQQTKSKKEQLNKELLVMDQKFKSLPEYKSNQSKQEKLLNIADMQENVSVLRGALALLNKEQAQVQEKEFPVTRKTYGLAQARGMASEENIKRIFDLYPDNEKRMRQLRICLNNAFTCLDSEQDIDVLAFESLAIIAKVYVEKLSKKAWFISTENKEKEILEKYFTVISQEDDNYGLLGVRLTGGRGVIKELNPKVGVSVTSLFARGTYDNPSLADVLFAEGNEKDQAFYSKIVEELYQKYHFGYQIKQLKAQADAAKKILAEQSETIKKAEELVGKTLATNEVLVVEGLKAQRDDIVKLGDCLKEIEVNSKELESIQKDLEQISGEDSGLKLQQLFVEKNAELRRVEGTLKQMLTKLDVYVKESSKFFVDELETCEKSVADLQAKLEKANKETPELKQAIADAKLDLEALRSGDTSAKVELDTKSEQIVIQNNKQYEEIQKQRKNLEIKRVELTQAEVAAEAQNALMRTVDQQLAKVKNLLQELQQKSGGDFFDLILKTKQDKVELMAMRKEGIELWNKLYKDFNDRADEVELLEAALVQAEAKQQSDVNKSLEEYGALQTSKFKTHEEKVVDLKEKIAILSQKLEAKKAKPQKYQDELKELKEKMEKLATLLTMVLNLPEANNAQSRMDKLSLDEQQLSLKAPSIEENENSSVQEGSGIFATVQTMALVPFKSAADLRSEVDAAISKWEGEVKAVGKEMGAMEQTDRQIEAGVGAAGAMIQQTSERLKAINESLEGTTKNAAAIVRGLEERNEGILTAAVKVSENLVELTGQIQKIGEQNKEARFALTHRRIAELTPDEVVNFNRLLEVLSYLIERKEELDKNKHSDEYSNLERKITNFKSLLLNILAENEETKRSGLFVSCVLILRDRTSEWSKYWIIGSIIDWILEKTKTTSTKIYEMSGKKLEEYKAELIKKRQDLVATYINKLESDEVNPTQYQELADVYLKELERKYEENGKQKSLDQMHDVLLSVMDGAHKLEQGSAQDRELFCMVCDNNLLKIGILKDDIAKMEESLKSILPSDIKKSIAIEINLSNQIDLQTLATMKTKLETIEKTLTAFKVKIEDGDNTKYFIFRQEQLRLEGKKIIDGLDIFAAEVGDLQKKVADTTSKLSKKLQTEKTESKKREVKGTESVPLVEKEEAEGSELAPVTRPMSSQLLIKSKEEKPSSVSEAAAHVDESDQQLVVVFQRASKKTFWTS